MICTEWMKTLDKINLKCVWTIFPSYLCLTDDNIFSLSACSCMFPFNPTGIFTVVK